MAIWIKTQPVAQTVAIDGTAVFTVEAESNSTPGETLYYQWQWHGVDGTYWGNSELPTANTPTLEVPGTTDRDGQQYRCYITTASGDETTSDVATLTVANITISKQPAKYIVVAVGDSITISVEATGVAIYQWQYKSLEGIYWSSVPWTGNTTATITGTGNENNVNFLYRCKLTDENGNVIYTDITQAVNQETGRGMVKCATIGDIADQIRTLIGSTGTMGLDTMVTNLTAANSAVASAKTAIANKDVSVPEDADISDLATLIESIYSDVLLVTATADNVLEGKVIVDANGNAVTGTMTNRGAVSTTVAAGGTYTIPAGYHNGSGKVTSAASSGYQVKTGAISVSGSPTSITIDHDLGKTPVSVILYKTGSTTSSYFIVRAEWKNNGSAYVATGSTNMSPTASASISTSSITFTLSSTQFYFYGSYKYVIWG